MLTHIPVEGGLEQEIAVVGDIQGAHWATDDRIVFARGLRGIWVVPADGSQEPAILVESESDPPTLLSGPQLLPDLNLLIYTRMRRSGAGWGEGDVLVRNLSSGDDTEVFIGVRQGRYLPSGHLVAYSGGRLYAAEFDPARPRRVANVGVKEVIGSVLFSDSYRSGGADNAVPNGDLHFSVSDDGFLAYIPATVNPTRKGLPVWVDARRRPSPVTSEIGEYFTPAISPDGRTLVISAKLDGENFRLHRIDLRTGSSEPFSDVRSILPAFSPDGEYVYFSHQVDSTYHIFRKPTDGSREAEPWLEAMEDMFVTDFSRDGKTMVIFSNVARAQRDIQLCTVATRQCKKVVESSYDERNGVLSPNGKWLAYSSNFAGVHDLFLLPVDPLGSPTRITFNGGASPVWSRSGESVYFFGDNAMMAVDVDPETGNAGEPYELFESEWLPNYYIFGATGRFALHPTQERFLLFEEHLEDDSPRAEFVVELNWFTEIREKLGAEP